MTQTICRLYRAWFLLLVAIGSVSACRSARTPATASEDFATFYEQFLRDSSFQMDRVRFPLPGEKVTAEVMDSTYRWQRNDWRMLSEPEFDSTYFTRDLTVTDTLATDEIAGKDSGLYFKMVYRPVDKKWHLVYLVDRDL